MLCRGKTADRLSEASDLGQGPVLGGYVHHGQTVSGMACGGSRRVEASRLQGSMRHSVRPRENEPGTHPPVPSK